MEKRDGCLFLEAVIDPRNDHIVFIEYLHKNREKSVIIGHNRSSNRLGDLKTRVGWDQSVICLRPIGQIEEAMCGSRNNAIALASS